MAHSELKAEVEPLKAEFETVSSICECYEYPKLLLVVLLELIVVENVKMIVLEMVHVQV